MCSAHDICYQVFNTGALGLPIQICIQTITLVTIKPNFSEQKIIALKLLVSIWEIFPHFMNDLYFDKPCYEHIILALKRGFRVRQSQVTRSISINLLFHILHRLAKSKDKLAPIVYKELTFLMVDSFDNLDQREEMYRNFISIFNTFHMIPIQILCQPLLKQI